MKWRMPPLGTCARWAFPPSASPRCLTRPPSCTTTTSSWTRPPSSGASTCLSILLPTWRMFSIFNFHVWGEGAADCWVKERGSLQCCGSWDSVLFQFFDPWIRMRGRFFRISDPKPICLRVKLFYRITLVFCQMAQVSVQYLFKNRIIFIFVKFWP